MNILESVIGALVDDLTAYIDANADFRTLRDAAQNAAISVATSETTSAIPTATTSTASSSTEPEIAPSLFSQVTFGAAQYLPAMTGVLAFTTLKAQKVTEAEKLKRSLKELQSNLQGIDESKPVAEKINKCLELLNAELAMMSKLRSEHDKERGKYDALLDTHKRIFEYLQQPANISLICICLRAETKEKVNPTNRGLKVSYKYIAPIPPAKALLNYLMETIISIQDDKARSIEKDLLKHVTRVPETAHNELISAITNAMTSLDSFNNMYITCVNSSGEIKDDPERLRNLCDVLGNLCLNVKDTAQKYTSIIPLIGSSNPFLDELVSELQAKHQATSKLYESRKKESLSATISGVSTEAPILGLRA